MAAFSSYHHFDTSYFWLPNAILEQPNGDFSSFTAELYNKPEEGTKVSSGPKNDEASVLSAANKKNSKNSTNSSSIVCKPKRRRSKQGCSTSALIKGVKEVKGKKQKKMEGCEEERKKTKEKKAAETGPTEYVHVRAKRGQATDSHSLAERVRRERISERMKLLQALVPGCDKVTGKALMLDEIINYVQSLQSQVEFLSMKLASFNPMFYDFGMDLEPFMVSPDQNLSSNSTTGNVYPFLDYSVNPLVFQPPQVLPNAMPPQGQRQALSWEVEGEDQRHKIIDHSSDTCNTLQFSFHQY